MHQGLTRLRVPCAFHPPDLLFALHTTMSTPLSGPVPHAPTSPEALNSGSPSKSGWLREPLLHFVLLGGLLFGVDHALVGRADDTNTIVVGADVDDEARKLFSEARGRAPQSAELTELRNRWLDNEVLYREGLAMRVDKGDPAIRDRVIFKALMSVEASLKLPKTDDQQLKQWFESHRAKYDQPARYDFLEAVLSGTPAEAEARALADTLNTGAAGEAETRAALRVFKGRPHDNLVQGYGADVAKMIEESPTGQWRALPTKDGWRVMRLEAITPPQPADFDAVREAAHQDWVDATMAQLRTDAVRAMAKKYTVKIEEAAK